VKAYFWNLRHFFVCFLFVSCSSAPHKRFRRGPICRLVANTELIFANRFFFVFFFSTFIPSHNLLIFFLTFSLLTYFLSFFLSHSLLLPQLLLILSQSALIFSTSTFSSFTFPGISPPVAKATPNPIQFQAELSKCSERTMNWHLRINSFFT